MSTYVDSTYVDPDAIQQQLARSVGRLLELVDDEQLDKSVQIEAVGHALTIATGMAQVAIAAELRALRLQLRDGTISVGNHVMLSGRALPLIVEQRP